jgi:hypothetical protein
MCRLGRAIAPRSVENFEKNSRSSTTSTLVVIRWPARRIEDRRNETTVRGSTSHRSSTNGISSRISEFDENVRKIILDFGKCSRTERRVGLESKMLPSPKNLITRISSIDRGVRLLHSFRTVPESQQRGMPAYRSMKRMVEIVIPSAFAVRLGNDLPWIEGGEVDRKGNRSSPTKR